MTKETIRDNGYPPKSQTQSHPPSTSIKVIANSLHENIQFFFSILVVCVIIFGCHYAEDTPSSVQKEIMSSMSLSETAYSYFNSAYSLPNIILPFLGGMLIDHIGARPGLNIFGVLVCVGQLLLAYFIHTNSFWGCILARALFGVGAECLVVAQSAILTKWFKNRALAIAYAINMMNCRAGGSLNDLLTPRILQENPRSLAIPFLFGFFLCLLSFLAGLFVCLMDKRRALTAPKEKKEKWKLGEVWKMGWGYWMLCALGMCIFVSVTTFKGISSKYMQDRFGATRTTAGAVNAIPYTLSALLSPLLGYTLDKFGYFVFYMIFSAFVCSVSHFSLGFLPDTLEIELTPMIFMISLGIGFTFFTSSVFPSVPYMVKSSTVGTAFGLFLSIINTGRTFAPIICGYVHDQTIQYKHGYFWVSMLLGTLALFGLVTSIAIIIYDKTHSQTLSSSATRTKEIANEAKLKEKEKSN